MGATCKYPNILAEYQASGWHITSLADHARVSVEVMEGVLYHGHELSVAEMWGLCNMFSICGDCRLDYMCSPALSIVNPSSNKGKLRANELCLLTGKAQKLLTNTPELSRPIRKRYERCIAKACIAICALCGDNEPITYAQYRWAYFEAHYVLQSLNNTQIRKEPLKCA